MKWQAEYAELNIRWRKFFIATLDGLIAIAVGIPYVAWHFSQPITSWLRNPGLDVAASLPLAYGAWRVLTTVYRWKTRTNGIEHPTIAAVGDVAIAVLIALMLSIT